MSKLRVLSTAILKRQKITMPFSRYDANLAKIDNYLHITAYYHHTMMQQIMDVCLIRRFYTRSIRGNHSGMSKLEKIGGKSKKK